MQHLCEVIYKITRLQSGACGFFRLFRRSFCKLFAAAVVLAGIMGELTAAAKFILESDAKTTKRMQKSRPRRSGCKDCVNAV